MLDPTIPQAAVDWAALDEAAPAFASVRRTFRVMIVDDNAQIVQISRMLLESEGHAVAVAIDGAKAVELAREFQPEVVLCDVSLPGELDGFAVARKFRHDPELCDAVLIAVTGHDDVEYRRQAEVVGFDRFLLKPVDFQELTGIIEQAVNSR